MIKIHSISLGCPKNRVDSEKYLGNLKAELCDSPAQADLVFINTCGFIKPAIEESVRTILEEVRNIAELEGKKPRLVVAGCLVGRYGEPSLKPDIPEVDLWLDNHDTSNWPEKTLAMLLNEGSSTSKSSLSNQLIKNLKSLPEPEGRILTTPPSYAWLKVSDGCEHKCAFCTIPSIRGPLRSRSIENIEAEAKSIIAQGVKELVLVAQDLLAWGKDLPPEQARHGLKSLLERLLPLSGLARLRLMYLYPAGLSKDLLAFLRTAGAPLVPYFDIPLQHAHPEILRNMGRPFAQNPELVLDRVREYFPEAALRTSLIVGYPGETQAHFESLMEFVEKQRFHHLGVFAFQPEEGTPAAKMTGKVLKKVKEARRNQIMLLQKDISRELLEEHLGQRLDVLVDAPHPEWPGLHIGRTWFQAPEVDGVTFVSGPGVEPGAMVQAEVVETKDYDLSALV